MPPAQRRVLIIGGSFAGLCVARDMATHFLVTIVDCKEFFEYTPGILRCFVKPKHFDSLSFNLHPVIENRMGCKFIWGEVTKLDKNQTATIKPMFQEEEEVIDFDFCVIASGCNFNPFDKMGESLWFPVVHACERKVSKWAEFDERFIEGRRRHIFDEYNKLKKLAEKKSTVLVVGAGFIGVEWITEIQHFFPDMKLKIVDGLPTCLGPLPPGAAAYCVKYMTNAGIDQYYNTFFKNDDEFYNKIGFSGKERPTKEYFCMGVKASNYFMHDTETLTYTGADGDKGRYPGNPGGGGWINMNKTLAVTTKSGDVWCKDDKNFPRIFAVGDCNASCIPTRGEDGKPIAKVSEWEMPIIPKISYPGEEEAVIAARNIDKVEALYYHGKTTDCCGGKIEVHDMHWPWGAGMFATSLGPHDACFVAGANYNKASGYTVLWGSMCAVQKEFIEHSKVNECEMGIVGRCIWHFVHHTPLHLWGGGPRWGY